MHSTNLRKVGGSVMLAVPPAILDMLHLSAGAPVGLSVEGNRLIIEARPRPHYTLDELLSQCDPNAPASEDDRAWANDRPKGGELI
ncbi:MULTISPECIES: antitoxin [Rhodomicrobium]|uniref:AbrB/MazE/SpoVT family DNA-binding domain-containing protein n=1 Tax=Rhodomicrobium TaxID=1068 RepID=UPI000B4BA4B2|nr:MULTISPECIES: antitoxin [Rhodomicrobium]